MSQLMIVSAIISRGQNKSENVPDIDLLHKGVGCYREHHVFVNLKHKVAYQA